MGGARGELNWRSRGMEIWKYGNDDRGGTTTTCTRTSAPRSAIYEDRMITAMIIDTAVLYVGRIGREDESRFHCHRAELAPTYTFRH